MFRFVSGFPGVGKTFLTNTANGAYKDSDSSRYPKDAFPGNYISAITSDGAKHFVSSHELVRTELKVRNYPYLLVYPAMDLRDEYMERYRARNSPTALIDIISRNWEDWVTSCINDVHPLVTHKQLVSGQYLSDIFG